MNPPLTYIAKVENGRIQMGERKRKRMSGEIARAFDGKTVTITVQQRKRTRTSEQNRYYWGVCVSILSRMFHDYNPDIVVTPELTHEFCKRRFLPMVTDWEDVKLNTPEGTQEFIRTTKTLTTTQFMDYITLLQNFAADYGWEIPDPHEMMPEAEAVDIDKQ